MAETLVREVEVKTKEKDDKGNFIMRKIRKVMFTQDFCEVCGVRLTRNSGGQVRRFCSKACRRKR